MRFNSLKATEPLRGDSLLFTNKSPGVPGTYLNNLGRTKEWTNLGATQFNSLTTRKWKFTKAASFYLKLLFTDVIKVIIWI